MVSEAQTQQSPTQRFTERFERKFVPMVLSLAVLLLFAGLVIDEPFSESFYRAMAGRSQPLRLGHRHSEHRAFGRSARRAALCWSKVGHRWKSGLTECDRV